MVLSEAPAVAETPAHHLDDETTPIARFFLRNNGGFPAPVADPASWRLTIDGEVERPLALTLAELKARFPARTCRMVLECGGNGRAFFDPPAQGNPWTQGGAGCAEWTGVPLAEVLREAGLKASAVYTAHYGADPPLSGDPARPPISRGMPMAKALEPHTLLVFGMNGEPLPPAHGGPLRLIVPGWPGSLSQKWLTRIWVRDREHDGPGMTGLSYRVPIRPIPPGGTPEPDNLRILESMPARSIITHPADGARFPAGTRQIALRGAAWAGDVAVAAVDLSADGGATWQAAALQPLRNRYDWARWSARIDLPSDGWFEICARATDSEGRMQPHRALAWNPQGYGCNAMHRIAVTVG